MMTVNPIVKIICRDDARLLKDAQDSFDRILRRESQEQDDIIEELSKKIALLDKYQSLFWYFNKSNLHTISDAVIVEFILNYGTLDAVKELFTVLGTDAVAKEFNSGIQKSRNNYFPQVQHFFNLYFSRNVPEYPFN
jgi:hypothetical protein